MQLQDPHSNLVVTRQNLESVVYTIRNEGRDWALDTETTGLRRYHGDRLFSLILSRAGASYYFNFNHAPDFSADETLPKSVLTEELADLWSARFRLWYMFNAKFDMSMLQADGVDISGVIWDTHVVARLERNDHMTYELAACLARIGRKKDDAVMAYLKEHGLWEWTEIPGKQAREKNYHFDKVPRAIIVPYGCQDGRETWELGDYQSRTLAALDAARPPQCEPLRKVLRSETALAKTTFHVERQGVHIDRPFCEQAIDAVGHRKNDLEKAFAELTGEPYKASGKLFARVFGHLPGIPVTAAGNQSFDADVLEQLADRHPAAKVVNEIRQAKATLDYFNGFLYHADTDDIIHANLNSAGTKTGRFSSSKPNLQNLKKAADANLIDEYAVRRALIPPPGAVIVAMDMDQAEYRLMLEYAGARKLIELVLGGLDVHQATANLASISRQDAKNANFAKIYGAGIRKLAFMLGCSLARAKEIVAAIDESCPEIDVFVRRVIRTAELRGYVVNWLGRRCYSADHRFHFRGPNAVIQGGVADIVKLAMVVSERFLEGRRSRLALNIHDELVYYFYPEDFHLIEELRAKVQAVYKHRFLPLTWGLDHSWKSLADKNEGVPVAN